MKVWRARLPVRSCPGKRRPARCWQHSESGRVDAVRGPREPRGRIREWNMPGKRISRRSALGGGALLAAAPLLGRGAHAQTIDAVRIGVLTDMSGPYVDSGGAGSVLAAKMAAADFGGTVLGK